MGKLYGSGIKQGDLKSLMDFFKTNFNGILTTLDADTGVSGTDYSTLWAVVAHKIQDNGVNQGDITSWLNTLITNINGVLVKLDDEALEFDDYYSSLNVTDVIDNPLAGHIKKNGMNQGNLVKLFYDLTVLLWNLRTKLDTDSQTASDYAGARVDPATLVDASHCTI